MYDQTFYVAFSNNGGCVGAGIYCLATDVYVFMRGKENAGQDVDEFLSSCVAQLRERVEVLVFILAREPFLMFFSLTP